MKHCYACLLALLLLPYTTVPQASEGSISLSKQEEFQAAFATVPCKYQERISAVKNLFLQMGAPEADITIEKFKGVENIVLRKQGETDEKIIIGAHYDFKGAGSCGAVDNWSGIVAIAHIYKSLKAMKLKKTLLFVGFGKEEDGLVGSGAMARQIKDDEVLSYCAMVNIDSLGMNTPQVMKSISSLKLENAAQDLAKKMEIPFQSLDMIRGSSDSFSFLKRKIPSLTISGIPPGWQDILHHQADQAIKVNPLSVYLGYRLALALVYEITHSDCGIYR